MIILDGQYTFDDKGESEVSRLTRPGSRKDTITGYLVSTQSRYVRWRFSCNLYVGKEDLETLELFFATHNGSFSLVDWRGFSWLVGAGTDDVLHAYSTGAVFDQSELVPQPQEANGYQAPCQSFVVPVTFVINARGIAGSSGGNNEGVILNHEVPGGTINSVNAVFTLSEEPATLILFKNGQEQKEGVDYTISGTTITFLVGAIPTTGSSLDSFYTV